MTTKRKSITGKENHRTTKRSPQRRYRYALATLLLVVVMGTTVGLWWGTGRGNHLGESTPWNLLLVTFDTTRADHLGCYGNGSIHTPTIDRLARQGVRYTRCYSVAPITLVSHTSLMTGLFPFVHKIHDNGMGPLDAKIVTLAEVLQQHGYQTGAVIAAQVLHSDYGLNQGFSYYDDDLSKMTALSRARYAERDARAVTDSALEWLSQRGERPYFLWVHYFDPHTPYQAPGADPSLDPPQAYDREIEYADSQFARLLRRVDEMDQNGTRQTLVLFTADHGEALGGHGEPTHGVLAYNETLRVPLILRGPAGYSGGAVVEAPVSLVDVYPSILRGLHMALPYEIHGRVLPMPDDPSASEAANHRACYFETYLPLHTYGWSSLEGVIVGRDKYIQGPAPEWFDLAADPHETKNLFPQGGSGVKRLQRIYGEIRHATMSTPLFAKANLIDDAENIQKLRALGYAGTYPTEEDDTATHPDPKSMGKVLLAVYKAQEQIESGKVYVATTLLSRVIDVDPSNHKAKQLLGRIRGTGVLPKMADALFAKEQYAEAEKRYRAALLLDPSDATLHTRLGMTLYRLDQAEKAIEQYRKALTYDPDSAEIHRQFASILTEQGKTQEAIRQNEQALRIDPDDATSQYNLGVTLLQQGEWARACEHFLQTVRIKPDHGDAYVNLGIALAQQGKKKEAKAMFRKAVGIESSAAEAHYNLGVTLAGEGNTTEAIRHLETALKRKPAYGRAAERLAGIYLADHQLADAIRVLSIGAAHGPDNVRIAYTLSALLATSDDAALRDGARAVTLAKRANELTQYEHPAVLAGLAAAYAETGAFDQAVKTARRAIERARQSKQPELVARIESQLRGYEKQKPYRNPDY